MAVIVLRLESLLCPTIDCCRGKRWWYGLHSCIPTIVYSKNITFSGGKTNHTTLIKLKADPTAQILGPHTLLKKMNSSMQLVCTVDNAGTVVWTAPNGTVVRTRDVTGPSNDMLEVNNVTSDGEWTCSAIRGSHTGTCTHVDSLIIELNF